MKILSHPNCTHQLGAPQDMQDGSCDALPVRYQETEHGLFAVSYWQPDMDDLAELLAGGGINLWVRAPGRQHPVVALQTFPNPEQPAGNDAGLGAAQREFGALLSKLGKENDALRLEVRQLRQEIDERNSAAEDRRFS